MFTIRPTTSPEQIEKYLGDSESLKESRQRREYLEKLATMHSGQEVYVEISGSDAYADIAKRTSEYGYTDRTIINIPLEIPEQIVTGYDDETWDLMFQKMELYHELGHVMYTDWPTFEGYLGEADDATKGFFKSMWNVLEDAAIERQLSARFIIESDLRVKNANLLTGNKPGSYVGISEMVISELMEYKYPVGWIEDILDKKKEPELFEEDDREIFTDEIKPHLDEVAPEIVAENDPVERNEKIFELYKDIKPLIGEGFAPHFGTDLIDSLVEGFEERHEGSEGSEGFDDIDGEVGGMLQSTVDVDAKREYQNQVKQEEKQNQDTEGSGQAWSRAIQTEYEEGTDMHIRIPSNTQGNYDSQRDNDAQHLSNALSTELGTRLRHAQKAKKQSGQSSGRLDPTTMHKSQKGDANIFKGETDPEEKDYNCMILMDRSGSMRNGMENIMPDTEEVSGALGYALEDIGVDVGIVSFSGGDIYLEKDFTQEMDSAKERIFRGKCGGGTPMSDALALSRARIEQRGGHPFVIVITDGEPDHRERYRDELNKCDFPVLGLYILDEGSPTEHHMNESAYFHRLEIRNYQEAVKGVRNLTKQVMF